MTQAMIQQRKAVRLWPALTIMCLYFGFILFASPNIHAKSEYPSETLIFSPKLDNAFYQSIFNDIIQGIKDAAEGDVHSVRLEKSQVPFDSRYWLDTYQPNNIISLGDIPTYARSGEK